jgi:hypothetical protein
LSLVGLRLLTLHFPQGWGSYWFCNQELRDSSDNQKLLGGEGVVGHEIVKYKRNDRSKRRMKLLKFGVNVPSVWFLNRFNSKMLNSEMSCELWKGPIRYFWCSSIRRNMPEVCSFVRNWHLFFKSQLVGSEKWTVSRNLLNSTRQLWFFD